MYNSRMPDMKKDERSITINVKEYRKNNSVLNVRLMEKIGNATYEKQNGK